MNGGSQPRRTSCTRYVTPPGKPGNAENHSTLPDGTGGAMAPVAAATCEIGCSGDP